MEEVEASFDRVFRLEERKDGSYRMFAETPSGRRIWVIWRYDREDEHIPDVLGELGGARFRDHGLLKEYPMTVAGVDSRSPERRARDERISAEPPLPPPDLPPDTEPLSMEVHQFRRTHPIAIAGIVENGLVRPVDPGVKLPEHSRVIIVASESM